MGAGILPIAYVKGEIYFLFGKEVSDGKWGDFGGGKEGNEQPFQTAVREGCEELNGFFGCKTSLEQFIKDNMILKLQFSTYTSYLFEVPYDENLPFYFKNNHQFIRQHLPHLIDKKGLFEKSEIKWFSIKDIKNKKGQFRTFYRGQIHILISKQNEIKKILK